MLKHEEIAGIFLGEEVVTLDETEAHNLFGVPLINLAALLLNQHLKPNLPQPTSCQYLDQVELLKCH